MHEGETVLTDASKRQMRTTDYRKDYKLARTLGQGSFAKVKIGTCHADGTKWAVKIIDRKALSADDAAALTALAPRVFGFAAETTAADLAGQSWQHNLRVMYEKKRKQAELYALFAAVKDNLAAKGAKSDMGLSEDMLDSRYNEAAEKEAE